jgi:hypothetical protein
VGQKIMTTVDNVPDKKDGYKELMTEIDAGNIRQAILMITRLPERSSQLDLLLRLAHAQAFELEQALEHALVVAHGFDHARSLDLDQANTQALAHDLARDYARVLDHAYTQASALERALARDASRNLAHIFACAREVEHAFARARERALYLDRDTHINKTIIGCLYALMYDGKS